MQDRYCGDVACCISIQKVWLVAVVPYCLECTVYTKVPIQVCSFGIDGPSLSEESLFKILFSDKNDKRFYTMGVENGHFIRDGAHYFYEYLVEKKIDPKDLEKKLKVKQLKILEDLLVAFAGLPEKSCASHKFWR